ncbi:tyrosine-type recombinase/integrase [Streptomyces anthocyanicus]|uniref:tyrosine-type recombinase/integrase n=1 Tax=Streptomyces anthocyanicus TaxID=68174 RepID=UPI0036AC7427
MRPRPHTLEFWCYWQNLRVIPVTSWIVTDSGTRVLSLVPPLIDEVLDESSGVRGGDQGLVDVLSLQRRYAGGASLEDEQAFFMDTLVEYQWARDLAGLASSTLDALTKPVIEVCDHYQLVPWRLTPRHVDAYFAGPGKRQAPTIRSKLNKIDHFFAFLEQRYAHEIFQQFGAMVESPIDPFNRQAHRGDFGLRVPPSARATKEFFAAWRSDLPNARKEAVACRDYVMSKMIYISGVRAAELCGMKMCDLHWESGEFGRFLVQGKGARGSGPRPREAYMFAEGRALMWWYVSEVRGLFADDPEHPEAPVWPSERLPMSIEDLNMPVAPAVTPSTLRKALKRASAGHLHGPVRQLFPHLLRHACATHRYEGGMSLWEVQKLLGHEWTTTTVRYILSAQGDPEVASRQSSARATQRLRVDAGSLS